jgi:hypothetical protein
MNEPVFRDPSLVGWALRRFVSIDSVFNPPRNIPLNMNLA